MNGERGRLEVLVKYHQSESRRWQREAHEAEQRAELAHHRMKRAQDTAEALARLLATLRAEEEQAQPEPEPAKPKEPKPKTYKLAIDPPSAALVEAYAGGQGEGAVASRAFEFRRAMRSAKVPSSRVKGTAYQYIMSRYHRCDGLSPAFLAYRFQDCGEDIDRIIERLAVADLTLHIKQACGG